ncbi:type II toxin-antitoxin system RelE/ParE family toxin [Flavobacterium restrictum]|uniref:Type II toxin-antitoxin system RelE/ParE family toxin n=1 Tax=Flavobacterium restrictum TaxID=2594428 RepID=A0A553DQJ2_9FLAO|nr:type II toxin-antitoxin system RelE/ParE family toxin [Flavobacterium restrictum]TRX34913.1 type II toxin-antitoxin system RelE/ParE family toxin [Flavobacterium restrictum]
MVYNLIVSPRAQKEIEKAIDSYLPNYLDIPNNFVIQLQSVYNTLKTNPFFRIRYKNIRSLKLKKYPYSLYFVVNENRNTVRVLSCFHNKRDPKKQPRF